MEIPPPRSVEIRLDGKLRAVRKQTGGSGQDV